MKKSGIKQANNNNNILINVDHVYLDFTPWK